MALALLFVPAVTLAEVCPFDASSERPSWVSTFGHSQSEIVAAGVVQYDASLHSSIFDLRQASEQQAILAITTLIESHVVNELLMNKTFQDKQLITDAKKITSQVSEYTLPEVIVNERWLDAQNCTMWTQVTVGEEVVSDYIDEVSELESVIEDSLDNRLQLSVREELNKKQFYLNYEGFSKAVQSTRYLEIDGVDKPALAWMLQEGFDPTEPSLGENGIWVEGLAVTFNLPPLALYLFSEAPTQKQVKYILEAYQSQGINVDDVKTQSHPQQFAHSSNYSDSDYFISIINQPNALEAPFMFSVSMAEKPEANRLKLNKEYSNRTSFTVGNWNLLHIATFTRRPDLIELLLEHGVDPNSKDAAGMSAAQYAIWTQDKSLIEPYLAHSNKLDDIYLTTTQVLLNKAIFSGDQMRFMAANSGDNRTLIELSEKIKAKSRGDVKTAQSTLKQNIQRLESYYAIEQNDALDENLKKQNIKMLKSIL
ncbi:ankyrin repeat domain-containing protein [Photobacterium rosenbergii]|nr:ankyrin repeat domain-containing protein [Photobacterium rosenbergii]